MKLSAFVFWAFFLVATAMAVYVVVRGEPLNAEAKIGLIAIIVSIAIAFVTRTEKELTRSADDELGRALENLAVEVRKQWKEEAGDRGLYPSPIALDFQVATEDGDERSVDRPAGSNRRPGWWVTIPKQIWNDIVTMSRPGPSMEPTVEISPIRRPAMRSAAGRSVSINDVVAHWKASSRPRITLLGRPGSGKTSALVLLLCEVMNDDSFADGVDPVPVIVNATSWTPETPFVDWFERRLIDSYKSLSGRYGRGRISPTIARALIDRGRVIPFLDGLDEISNVDDRYAVLRQLNTSQRHSALAITCRTEEYHEITREYGSYLVASTEYEIEPVSLQQAAVYLNAGHKSLEKWREVFDAMREGGPLAAVLSTPLMLFLAKTAYSRRNTDPKELLRFKSAEGVQRQLVDHYIPAVYAPEEKRLDSGDRKLELIERTLSLLAQHLDRLGTTDFAWWHLHQIIGSLRFRIVRIMLVGVVFAIAYGMIGVYSGNTIEVVLFGLSFGIMFVLFGGLLRLDQPPEQIQFRLAGLTKWVTIGGISGLLCSIVDSPMEGILGGAVVGLGFGVLGRATVSVAGRFRREDLDESGSSRRRSRSVSDRLAKLLKRASAGLTQQIGSRQLSVHSPSETLSSDRRSQFIKGATLGISFGVAYGAFGSNPDWSPVWFLYLLGCAVVLGTFIRLRGASGNWALCTLWLRLSTRLPVRIRLMKFLDDANRRHVLRRVGSVYQFRHKVIQDQLAGRDPAVG